MTKIEQMGTGAVYCQVFDIVYPGSIQLTRISWAAKNEYEYVQNYKLLQSGFNKQSQKKYIDVNLKFYGGRLIVNRSRNFASASTRIIWNSRSGSKRYMTCTVATEVYHYHFLGGT